MRRALRVTLTLAAGLILWFLLSPALHALLVSIVAPLFRGVAFLAPDGPKLVMWPLEHPSARMTIQTAPATTNLVLLVALWAWDARSFRGPALTRLLAAAAMLVVLQGAAFIAAVHATLAVPLAQWSGDRYGTLAANLWLLAWQGYQIVGAPAAAFAAWWALRSPGDAAPARRRRGS